jgi:hypothetical protein
MLGEHPKADALMQMHAGLRPCMDNEHLYSVCCCVPWGACACRLNSNISRRLVAKRAGECHAMNSALLFV